MLKLVTLVATAVLTVALAGPALARDGEHRGHEFHDRDGRHGFRGGIFLYDPGFAYPYGQSGLYAHSYPPSGYAYYCPTANAFYPFVASCPLPWQVMPAR